MRKPKRTVLRASFAMESMEDRRMLTVSSPGLIDLDLLRANYPTVRGAGQIVVVIDTGFSDTYQDANHVVVDNPHFAQTVDYVRMSKLWTNPYEIPGNLADDDGDGLTDNIHGWNYFAGTNDIHDDNGHGTAIAGVIASYPYTYASTTYSGVAPDVQILPLKIESSSQTFTTWQRINEAFKWVYTAVTRATNPLPIAAINLSWGFFPNSRVNGQPNSEEYTNTDANHAVSIQTYVQNLRSLGVFTAQAAGNSGNALGQRPGTDNDVMVVGSLNSAGNGPWVNPDPNAPPYYKGSNYGPSSSYVDLYAPGYWPIVNSDPFNQNNAHYNQTEWDNDGATSWAAPFAAGAAALLKAVNPEMPAGDVTGGIFRILQQSSTTTINDNRSGSTWTDSVIDLDSAAQQAITSIYVGERGTFNDIQYDQAGNLHMAWYDDSAKILLYAKRTGSVWGTPQVIDAGAVHAGLTAPTTGVGEFVSLALDETNPSSPIPAVAYYSSDLADLMFAQQSGTTWNVTTIESTNTVGRMPSLAYNPDTDLPAISYFYENGQDLRLAEFTGSAWSISTVQTSGNIGRYSRLAFHPGTRHWAIAYDDATSFEAKYIQQIVSGSNVIWDAVRSIASQAPNIGVAFTDLKFDTVNNRPAVSFYYTHDGDLNFGQASDSSGVNWASGVVGSSNGIKGLYTNLHFSGISSHTGRSLWDIVYYNKSNISVDIAQGNLTDLWLFTVGLRSDGGSNLAAEWRSGTLTFAYTLSTGVKLSVYN